MTTTKFIETTHFPTITNIEGLIECKNILHKNTEITDTWLAKRDLLLFWKNAIRLKTEDIDLFNLAKLTLINRAGLINNYSGNKKNALKCFDIIATTPHKTVHLNYLNFLKCAAEINTGTAYYQNNIFWKSLNHFSNANEILRKHLPNESRLKIQLFTNLGNLYQLIDKEKALKIFLDTIELIKNKNYSIETARVYYNTALTCSSIGDFATALNFLETAHKQYNSLKSRRGEHITLLAILNLYIKHNLIENANKYLNIVLESDGINFIENEYKVFHEITIGNFYFSKKEFDKALIHFESAIKINKTTATKAELLQVLKSLSEIYEQQGDYQRAFETMKKKDSLHEELFGEEKLRLFRNIEQQQEEMLQRERALELEQKVRQLEHAALLSQMNPHFIFNSLNTLQNLVIEGNEEAAINFISEFSILMREMLNNAKEELIPLKNEIEFLRRYVQLEEIRFNNHFNFHCSVDDVLPKHLVKIPVMLIQPLLENAIRHGLAPSKNEKSLSLFIRNGGPFIIVEVSDNGIGWKSNTNQEHKSHALDNIRERLSLMRAPNHENGRMEISSTPSQGTQITLWIPVQF